MGEREKIAQIIAEHLCPQGKAHKTLYGAERMCYSRNNFADCEKVSECVDALIAANIGDVTAWKERAEKAGHSRLNAYRDDSKLEYKGFHSYIHYSAADKVLYGKIEGIKDLVDFESESAVEIENEFHKAVDDYIAFCEEIGKNVEKEKEE